MNGDLHWLYFSCGLNMVWLGIGCGSVVGFFCVCGLQLGCSSDFGLWLRFGCSFGCVLDVVCCELVWFRCGLVMVVA